ncbi:MAG: hypothetical protein COT09_03960 [Candidatus Hydromicrobium americanum]|nr:MAG: hypothetical protein COT09_03960 [Candidatus Hydromicrobium americanum]
MNVLLWSIIIFISILVHVLFGTVRLTVMVKNKKILTTLIGFFESAIGLTIAITVISRAVREGINIYIILSYAAGFALGLYVGMYISQLISKDILSINIFSKLHSNEIENYLREKGFGVTCYYGSGKDGNIKVLNIICKRNNFTELKSFVKKIDSKVLVTSHHLEGLSGGFIYDIKSRI